MNLRLKGLAGLLTLAIGSMVLPQAAWGQTTSEVPGEPSLRDQFLDAYYSNSGTFYRNRTVFGQLNWMFGPYVENQITRDGRAVHRLYQDALQQQVSSDPAIRTPDLVNPFNTSFLLLPTTSLTATEDLVAPAPLPQPTVPFVDQPVAPPPQVEEAAPVPGLW